MKKVLIFLVGASLAAVAGYKIGYMRSKKYYEHLADEEVAAVRKVLLARYSGVKEEAVVPEGDNKPIDEPKKEEPKKPVVKKVNGKIDYSEQYRTGSDQRIPGDPGEEKLVHIKEEEVDTTKPYIMTPEEFQDSEYETVTLYYTADKVLTDDDYNQLNNIGIVGGYPNLDKMGIYDADCLFICDEKKGIVYEVLLEERTYDQINGIIGVVEED